MEEGIITVMVEDGTYQPSRIKLPAGEATNIQFLRRDETPCAATVLIPDIEINEDLPLNQVKTLSLPALSKGEYPFSCQMQMYRGTLIVE